MEQISRGVNPLFPFLPPAQLQLHRQKGREEAGRKKCLIIFSHRSKTRLIPKSPCFPRVKGMEELLLLQGRGGTLECPSHATAAIPMGFLQPAGPPSAPLLGKER